MKRFFCMIVVSFLSTCLYAEDMKEIIGVVEQTVGRFSIYDASTGQNYGSLKVGDLPHEVILSQDKKTAYVSNFGLQDYDETIGKPGVSISVVDMKHFIENRRLYIFDPEENKTESEIDGAPHGMFLRPPFEKELYVNAEKGEKMYVFDLETGEVVRKFPLVSGTHNLIFSPKGDVLWLVAGKEGAVRMDPDTGKVNGQLKLASPIRALMYTPDNRYIMASAVNEVVLFDPDTLKIHKRYENLWVGQILYSDITPDGKWIVSPAVWDAQAIIIDTESGKVIKRIVTGLDPVTVKISKDGKFAYVTNARDTHVTKINMKTFDYENIETQEGPNGLIITDFSIPETRKTLNIGVALPLTGKDADKGRDLMLGYEFWKISAIKSGGLLIKNKPYDINFIYLDTKSENTHILDFYSSLAKEYDSDVLFPTYGKIQNDSIEKEFGDDRIPFFYKSMDIPSNENQIMESYFVTHAEFKSEFEKHYNLKTSALSSTAFYNAIEFQRSISKNSSDNDLSLKGMLEKN